MVEFLKFVKFHGQFMEAFFIDIIQTFNVQLVGSDFMEIGVFSRKKANFTENRELSWSLNISLCDRQAGHVNKKPDF